MPLSPAPLMPGTSPLPTPGRRPPGRRALRMGALVAIPLLLVSLAAWTIHAAAYLFLALGFWRRLVAPSKRQAAAMHHSGVRR